MLALLILLPGEVKTAFTYVIAAGLVHFWFGFYYGFGEIKQSYNGRGKYLIICFLVYTVFVLFYKANLLSISLFGVHVMLSEAYFALRERGPEHSRLIFARAIFEGVIYFTVSFHYYWFKYRMDITYSLLFVSLFYFLYEWYMARKSLGVARHFDILGCQIVSLIVFGLVYFVLDLKDLHASYILVLLHGGPWILYPLVKNNFVLQKSESKKIGIYVLATLVMIVVTVPLMASNVLFLKGMYQIYHFWFNIHILQGFIATYALPKWFKDYFNKPVLSN
jgi:hypothetical protein